MSKLGGLSDYQLMFGMEEGAIYYEAKKQNIKYKLSEFLKYVRNFGNDMRDHYPIYICHNQKVIKILN
jgi:hypothetical protein